MLRIQPAFSFRKVDSTRKPTLILVLTLIVCSLFWEGCSGLSQVPTGVSNTVQPMTMQSSLPGSTVGSSYREVISVSGGTAPYVFVLSQGSLPPGLGLSPATGSISGVPTQAGTYSFTITVNGETAIGSSASHAYTVPIAAATSSITVQVSPADPSVASGGSVQFSALVSNTSNTSVTWTASAGTISTSGLFTAPASTTSQSVTITATSAADSSVHASTIATVSSVSSQFMIVTTSLPSAIVNTAYSALLSASGGQAPYQWSIASGSLPAGLQLNATSGTLSGSPTSPGALTFTVQAADSASHTAQQRLTLDVSAQSVNCGPPTYNCSRTDYTIAQIPSTIPNVGNVSGANTIVTDPDFGNRIVRITDWNTDPGLPSTSRSFVSAASGSADENLWNLDSTMFILQSLGDWGYTFTFDPATLQATRMYTSSYASTGGLKLSNGGTWSRVNANILYTWGGTVISKYDFSNRTTPPSAQQVYDFTSSRNCLPAGFSVTWTSAGGVSAGDTVFGMAFSNTGIQGTGVYAMAYTVGKGCTVLNTQTGQVTGDWGTTGTINIGDRWTIHNAKISKDGNWLIVVPTTCLSSTCSTGPYFWQIGTTNVSSCGDGKSSGQMCGGHWTEGYTHWINNYDNGKEASRPFSDPTAFQELNSVIPTGIQPPLDEHASWNNADPADSLPFFLTYWSTTTPFPAAWYNEITGVAPDGSGKVWRFAHSFITAQSQIFSTSYGIGSVSQDGRFFLFSSDWMGTLGSQSEASTCTIGTDCRGDVFIVELN
jgi:hypothetical protein